MRAVTPAAIPGLALSLALSLAVPLGLACSGGGEDSGTGGGDSGDTGTTDIEPPGEEVASSAARETDPDVSTADLEALTAGNRAFAFDLYQQLLPTADGNLFLSPHSISLALAMQYAGAEGATGTQMADALHFDLPEDRLHPAFNALDLTLETRSDLDPEMYPTGDGFQLEVVNQFFGQTGFSFEEPFLEVLAVHYGAGLRLLDFAGDPDGNRVLINDWVAAVTRDRIENLLPDGSIDTLTRAVLVNAIYFKASWDSEFDPADTTTDPFSTLGGGTVSAETMHVVQDTRCGAGTDFVVADLPYVGQQLAMTLLVPDDGTFAAVEAGLDAESFDAAVDTMDACTLTLALPKFSFETGFEASDPLMALGMVDAFTGAADFSGMTTADQLVITGVYHKAFVAIDEQGTEAAAATAVVDGGTSAPEPVSLTVDRPFLFLVRDRPTGAVLFLGRVLDPTAG